VMSRDVSENMPNFTENSRAPRTLFRGAMLMQTKKSVVDLVWWNVSK